MLVLTRNITQQVSQLKLGQDQSQKDFRPGQTVGVHSLLQQEEIGQLPVKSPTQLKGWGTLSLALRSRTLIQQQLHEQTPDPLAAAMRPRQNSGYTEMREEPARVSGYNGSQQPLDPNATFKADRQWQESCNEVMAIYRMTTLLSMGCKIKLSAQPKNKRGDGYAFRTDPEKSIDFVLVYRIPIHRKDPEMERNSRGALGVESAEEEEKPKQGRKSILRGRPSLMTYQDIRIDIEGETGEIKHIRNRKSFHNHLRRMELNLEFEDFRVAGDALRVVKINIPDHVMSRWAEKFGFEKPLKYDRRDFTENTEEKRKRSLPGLARKPTTRSFFSDFSPSVVEEEESGGEKEDKGVWDWIEEKFFYILHGKVPFYTTMRDNFYPRYVKAPYVTKHKDKFIGSERRDFFTTSERSTVVYRLLQQAPYHKDGNKEYFGVDELVANGTYKAAYPLHDGPYETEPHTSPSNHRQLLRFYWASFGRWNKFQPLNLIRMYFGEKVAMYFAWTGFYTQSLFIPAIVGILVFGYSQMGWGEDYVSKHICDSGSTYLMCPVCETNECKPYHISEICYTAQMATSVNNPSTLLFCVFMSIWVAYFLESWKRKQALLGHIWGVLNFDESEEQVRPTYTQNCDSWKYNPRTRRQEPYMTRKNRYSRLLTSFGLILVILACVIIFAIAVIVYDLAVYLALFDIPSMQNYARWFSSVSAGIMSLTLIIIMSKYYAKFAGHMTDWENYRTQLEYENNLTIRRYVFEVFNFYSSLVYIGFFKGKFNGYPGNHPLVFGVKMEDCPPGGCISELATQMAIILAGKQFIFTFSQFVIPIIFSNKGSCLDRVLKNAAREDLEGRRDKSPWERDYELAEARDVFAEYLEMVIQYGFVTIFVAAFPLAPLLALVNNLLETRLDAFKFVAQLRRPTGLKCKDIGIWYSILSAVGKIAIVCNAGIIAFSSDFLPMMLYAYENSERLKADGYDDPLTGYVNFSLAYASPAMTGRNGTCRYWAYRDEEGKHNFFFWKLFAVQLLFVITFEHVVFGIVQLIDVAIPDIPGCVQLKIDIDAAIAKLVLADEANLMVDSSTMTDESGV